MQRLLFCLIIFFVTSAWASPPLSPVTKYAGETSFGNYTPENAKSLKDLPAHIRLKLLAHLRTRLGPFMKQLTFSGGQIVNFQKLKRDEPNSKNYEWEVHAYDLHFDFKMPEIGIQSYTAQIELRRDGSVLEEIDLPAFATSPDKLNFFSLIKAVSVAVSHGFTRSHMRTEILYLKEVDSLVWSFSQVVADDGLIINFKNIYVSAHNGDVLKTFSSKAIR